MSAPLPFPRVLIWTPEAHRFDALKHALERLQMRGVRVGPSVEGTVQETRPAVALVDGGRAPDEALEVCGKILARARGLPVLLVVPAGDTETLLRARKLGVGAFGEEPCTADVLAMRVRELRAARLDHRASSASARSLGPSVGRDDLTGLSSRPSFLEGMASALERARVEGHSAALLYLDIDRFKGVNDALGHEVGDMLLRRVARILEDQVRASDLVQDGSSDLLNDASRIGGDEFTVLLSRVGSPADAGEVARRIGTALRAPALAGAYQLAATASIGVAMFPSDARDPEGLLRCADLAMYAAKAEGRGRHRFYEPSMGAVHRRRMEVEERLRSAIERDELRVHYQPRVDLANDVISGVEALVRWHSPDLGEVPPKEFIPIAEEGGLIIPLGAWVLETACKQLRDWQEHDIHGLRLSVNVSAVEFSTGNVLSTVADVLQRTGVDPHCLEVEVTERLMLGADEETALSLRDLRSIGVTVALDDFGTGYSSLSSITRFPLDVLKIDRSIAAAVDGDPAAASIVSAIVTLGRSLGLGIVAEGVDGLAQCRILTSLGCDELQGFLVTPALDAASFVGFYHDWSGVENCKGPADAPPEG